MSGLCYWRTLEEPNADLSVADSDFTELCMRAKFLAIQPESNDFRRRQFPGSENSKSEDNGDVYMIFGNW